MSNILKMKGTAFLLFYCICYSLTHSVQKHYFHTFISLDCTYLLKTCTTNSVLSLQYLLQHDLHSNTLACSYIVCCKALACIKQL